MSSPVTAADFESAIPAPNANVCDKLTAFFGVPADLAALLEWMLDSAGNPSAAFKAALSQSLLPPGAYIYGASANMGDDWLLCDGRAVSRTTYANLFSAIGTFFGVGDGSTTFNLPTGSQKSLIGVGGAYTPGQSVGELAHTMQENELVPHLHEWSGPEARTMEKGSTGTNIGWRGTAAADTEQTGGGVPFNVVHPCIVAYLFIHV